MLFENAEYQTIIDKVNKIRGYGLSKIITIPQIAILGDQSSGKSSVLEAITKLSFPRNIETCTRFATQVSLRQNERAALSAHIDDEPEFNKSYHSMDATADIHPIISAANRILCSRVEISDKVLQITISGPNLSPLTIIDLPGYINTTIDGQDKSIVETIRNINTRYIKNSRTIILAVVPANVDLNNIYALGEAERYDPSNERTIPIVTKPDTVEEDLLPGLVQTILNKRKHMKLGYLVMKNSGYKDIQMPWEEASLREHEFFQSNATWSEVPDNRKGRASVERFLGELLVEHIKKELPLLKRDILALMSTCGKDISAMGPPVSNIITAKQKYFESIMCLRSSLIDLLDGRYDNDYIKDVVTQAGTVQQVLSIQGEVDDFVAPVLTGDNEFIRASLHKFYEHFNVALNRDKYILPTDKITELVIRFKGKELPGFFSFTTFTQIYRQTLDNWHEITKVHVFNMHMYFFTAVSDYIARTTDPLLKDTLLLEFAKFYNSQVIKIDEAIENIFTDEGSPFTLNKYYFDNIMKSRKKKVEKKLREFLANFKQVYDNDDESTDEVDYVGKLEISDWDINSNEKHAVEDLKEVLTSYCKVARKRIVDVVILQSIERYLIKQINQYFDLLIAVDESTISNLLLETRSKVAQRGELENRLSVLRKSLTEL